MHETTKTAPAPSLDFSNSEIAFSHMTDRELGRMAWLFRMMSNPFLVKYGSNLALFAVKWRLPMAEWAVRNTIFQQFCSGTSLFDSQKTIKKLGDLGVLSFLDYGAEGKETEQDFNATMNENIRAIEFAAREAATVPVVTTKISGLARFELLENISSKRQLNREELGEYRSVLKRIDAICHAAAEREVEIFIDAEESWIQPAIDHLTWLMMKRYNKERVVVFNTFQMYRHDRLAFLAESFDRSKKEGFLLGAKLVRGAYMVKERARAEEMGYPSPIQPSKEATDDAFDTAIRFCLDNIERLAVCNASHNQNSAKLMAELMAQKGIPPTHPHASFCQLLGMSGNMTFNLARAGYRVGKYMVYGQVREVIPYLIRRAQENTSVTGDVGRELTFIQKEIARRGL